MMERSLQIKMRVSAEEKEQIERNAKDGGYANISSYIRHRCLNESVSSLLIYEKCEIYDSLQRIRELSDNDSRIVCHVDRIYRVLDGGSR